HTHRPPFPTRRSSDLIQTLFQLDNSEMNVDEAIGYIVETPLDSFYEQLVRGTAEHLTEIDSEITNKLENWTIDRLPKIERTVLRDRKSTRLNSSHVSI